ncbi:heme ABC exporter ATP-binding protein CcmA [Sphingomicrobium sp. B8]|uniref:Heme ABC exporter ATP-binding protein CcmA n=2 Tax=Sphingomicrobium clamense TaxID=2851013 RepID=A0ABS6V2K3_9SPHN|nr:heme ABC exporter ATP-binding protein CcmA [Sphingomicrobium sp. B8]
MMDVACLRGGRMLFEGLDLTLHPGEAVHVTGANGSGKSSLIRLVAGLLAPAAGSIDRADCALADEKLALDRELSLDRALAFWIDDPARRSSALAAMGLEIGQVPVRLLSTGQRQRARLARVVASDAPLWLLDEPLNGLDQDAVGLLDTAVRNHLDNGGAVLAASHVPMAGDWRSLAL